VAADSVGGDSGLGMSGVTSTWVGVGVGDGGTGVLVGASTTGVGGGACVKVGSGVGMGCGVEPGRLLKTTLCKDNVVDQDENGDERPLST
jgi:hypothetical protein